jgi:hypothetical protein
LRGHDPGADVRHGRRSMRVSQEESVWSWHLKGNSSTGARKANENSGQRASGMGENGLQALLLS